MCAIFEFISKSIFAFYKFIFFAVLFIITLMFLDKIHITLNMIFFTIMTTLYLYSLIYGFNLIKNHKTKVDIAGGVIFILVSNISFILLFVPTHLLTDF